MDVAVQQYLPCCANTEDAIHRALTMALGEVTTASAGDGVEAVTIMGGTCTAERSAKEEALMMALASTAGACETTPAAARD
jgi:hypothetical protein